MRNFFLLALLAIMGVKAHDGAESPGNVLQSIFSDWQKPDSPWSYGLSISLQEQAQNRVYLELKELCFYEGEEKITTANIFPLDSTEMGHCFKSQLDHSHFLSLFLTSRCLKNKETGFEIIKRLEEMKLIMDLQFFGPLPFFEMMHVVEFAKILTGKPEASFYFCQSLANTQIAESQQKTLWECGEIFKQMKQYQNDCADLEKEIQERDNFIKTRQNAGKTVTPTQQETLEVVRYRLEEKQTNLKNIREKLKNNAHQQITQVLTSYGINAQKSSLISAFFQENWDFSSLYCFYEMSDKTRAICEKIVECLTQVTLFEKKPSIDSPVLSPAAEKFLKEWSALPS